MASLIPQRMHMELSKNRVMQKNRNSPVGIFERLEARELLTGVPSVVIDGNLSESFENESLSSAWSTREISSVIDHPSAEKSRSGSQSVRFESLPGDHKNAQLTHQFEKPEFGRFSVWFYDAYAGDNNSNYFYFWLENSENGETAWLGVQDWVGDYYWGGHSSGGAQTSVRRTSGWHEFTVVAMPNELTLQIDGINVYHSSEATAFDQVSLDQHAPVWRPNHRVGYFDDFEFSRIVDVQEGTPIAYSGDFVDIDSHEWAATVDYGDGSEIQPLTLDSNSFLINHTYQDDGVFPITVRVIDNDGQIGSAHLYVRVNNVSPSVDLNLGFKDDFEGAALNSFWSTRAISGVIDYPSTEQSRSGSQSVRFESLPGDHKSIQLTHQFEKPEFGRFSVWFYDAYAGDSNSNYFYFWLENSKNGETAWLGVQDWVGDYYWAGHSSSGAQTSVRRTSGWHEFTVVAMPDELTLQIDGIDVYHSTEATAFDQVSLDQHAPVWRPNHRVGYFDDFEFSRHLTIDEKTPFNLSGQILDPGLDEWTITISFGDGSEPVALLVGADGAFDVQHVYQQAGQYRAYVQAEDDDGGFETQEVILTVLPQGNLKAEIIDVSPDPRASDVDEITFRFSQSVTNFDLADLVLTRNGHDVSLEFSNASLRTTDQIVWTLGNLAEITDQPGEYRLTLRGGPSGPTAANGSQLVEAVFDTWKDIRDIGDANLDGVFDTRDLVHIFQSAKYNTGLKASWSQGDWNGDGLFDQKDLVFAMQRGGYRN